MPLPVRLALPLAVLASCGHDAPAAPPPSTPPAVVAPPSPPAPSAEPAPTEPPPPALPPHVMASHRPAERTTARVTAITAGSGFGCALFEGGSVECWGATALAEEPAGPFTELVAGDTFACALRDTGRIACWGETGGWREPPDEPLAHLVAARTFACAQRRDRSVACFGNADSSRLEVPSGPFTELAIHDPTSCGLRPDGRIDCWGLSAPTLEGGGFTDVASAAGLSCGLRGGEILCAGYGADTNGPPVGPFSSFAPTRSIAGGGGICALRPDGEVACFGFDGIVRPPAPPSGPFTSVSVARTFVCAIHRPLLDVHSFIPIASALECWGLEVGPNDVRAGIYEALALGEGFGCALRRPIGGEGSRDVECFGSIYRHQARPPEGAFHAIAAGRTHTCGARSDGTLACWGEIDAPPTGTFASVVAGDRRSCALGIDGTLACWGRPLAVPDDAPAPPLGDRVRAVAMADHVECAAMANGHVRCWGPNTWGLDVSHVRGATNVAVGESGLFVEGERPTCFAYDHLGGGGTGGGAPAPTWHETPCTELGHALDAGGGSICGLDDEGTVRCAPLTTGLGSRPVDSIDGGPFSAFDVGPSHGCAIRQGDRELRCWGDDAYGETLPPTGGFRAITAGGVHSCGLRDDGTVACWGSYAGTPL